MSSLPYLNLSSELTVFGVILTVLTNSVLIYLTCNRVKNINPEYKFLILMLAVIGIIFSLIEILVHPFLHSFNGSFAFFSISLASPDYSELRVALLSSYSIAYVVLICCLAIQFIYRYFVLLLPTTAVKLFRGFGILIWLLYGFICMTIWIASLTQCLPDNYTRMYLKEEMIQNYEADVSSVPGYHLVAYNEHGSLRFKNLIGICCFTLVLSIQYLIIFYSGIKTHYGIKSIASMSSAKVHRLHSQLFKTLVIQITVPTLFYNSPVLIMYVLPYFNWKLSFPSGLMVCMFSLYPAADSLILMVMVAEYHRLIKKMLKKILLRVSQWAKINAEDSTEHEINVECPTRIDN